MYINFKSKYKKIFWFLIGFLLACCFINRVNALSTSYGELPDIPNYFPSQGYTIYRGLNNNTNNYEPFLLLFDSPTDTTAYITAQYGSYYRFAFYTKTRLYLLRNNSWSYDGTWNSFFQVDLLLNSDEFIIATSIPITSNVSGVSSYDAGYGLGPSLPDYLQNYKKITLGVNDKYYMLSGLSSGSIFIPIEDFNSYGGRLSYYDNDLSSQPFTSYIQDYVTTEDGLFVRQDFNLSDYYGADWVMFSKYLYLEGEDNISYDIWVPDDIYDSQVTITPNSSGGNTFDFDYEDSQGNVQNGQVNSVDLSQDNPLLGNIFSDFSSNTFGLTSIVTSPLSLISSLSSTSCSTLTVPLPYISSNLTLPCMYSVYSTTFGSFFTLYQTITTGIISYWVIVKIFNLVKDFKNPDHDEIEVIDL